MRNHIWHSPAEAPANHQKEHSIHALQDGLHGDEYIGRWKYVELAVSNGTIY